MWKRCVTAAGVVMALAACGGSSTSTGSTGTGSTGTTVSASTSATTGTTASATTGTTATSSTGTTTGTAPVQVDARNLAFSPAGASVQVGQSVTWTNRDTVDHTVTSGAPRSPDGRFDQLLHPGESFTFAFTQAGTYSYFCRIHVNMGMSGSIQAGAGSTSTTGSGTATSTSSTGGATTSGTTRY
jgi:plastocyanin